MEPCKVSAPMTQLVSATTFAFPYLACKPAKLAQANTSLSDCVGTSVWGDVQAKTVATRKSKPNFFILERISQGQINLTSLILILIEPLIRFAQQVVP